MNALAFVFSRFMWTLHTANPEHWVPIKTVASFKRMREFSDLGFDWVVNALRQSDTLEVDDAGENVRRCTEVTEPKGQFERSIYAVRRFPSPSSL
jgi:lupus La protein